MVVAALSGRRLSPSADFDYINVLALHSISHHLTVVSLLFCGLKKRITPKIRILYLALINSVRFNRSCIWISWAYRWIRFGRKTSNKQVNMVLNVHRHRTAY